LGFWVGASAGCPDHFANHRACCRASLLITAPGTVCGRAIRRRWRIRHRHRGAGLASIGIHGLKAAFLVPGAITLAGPAWLACIAWINSVHLVAFWSSILGWLTDTFGTYKAGIYALAALKVVVALLAALVLRQGAGKSRA